LIDRLNRLNIGAKRADPPGMHCECAAKLLSWF
jgi:hypothetical protein